MQTYMVHIRQPVKTIRAMGWRGWFGFHMAIGTPVLTFLTLPVALLLSVGFMVMDVALPGWLQWLSLATLIGGYSLFVVLSVVAIIQNKWFNIIPLALIFPLYWCLHAVASYIALVDFTKRPHHWSKTEHGLSRML